MFLALFSMCAALNCPWHEMLQFQHVRSRFAMECCLEFADTHKIQRLKRSRSKQPVYKVH